MCRSNFPSALTNRSTPVAAPRPFAVRVRDTLLRSLVLLLLLSPAAQAQTPVRVGVYENPPKVFTRDDTGPTGFFIDILRAIAEREEWKLEYVACEWDACLNKLERGEIDLMPDVAYSATRDERFDFHREVVLSNWSLLYSREPHRLKSILDLDGKRIAVIANSIQYHVLRQRVKEFNVEPVFLELDSSRATVDAVAEDRADAALINRLYGLQAASAHELKPTHILVESSHLYYATAEGRNARLLERIDMRLAQFKGNPRSIYYTAMARWIDPLEQDSMPVWLIWFMEALALFTILLLVVALTLRRLMNKKTRQLKKTNRELSESELMFRTLFETSRDAMMLASGEDFIDCNPEMLRMFGYPSVEAMRQLSRDDIFPPQQEPGTLSSPLADQKIEEAFRTGYARFEWIHRRADGSTFPSEVTLVPMTVHNRQLIQATIRDISEKKHNEISLRQLNRALQTLSRVNHILIHSHDEASLLDNICRTIVDYGNYRFAWIGIAKFDDERRVEPVAQYGYDDNYLENLTISWQNDEFGQGPTGIAIRSGKPSLVRDIHNDPRYTPWREEARKRDYASSIALPLVNEGTVIGALNIYSRYPDAFGESEVMLLKELAEDLSFGIHTQRMKLDHTAIEEERKGHKQRLQDALLQTIQAITVMVEKRDPFTAGHQRRVADLAVHIAKQLELDAVRTEGLRFGAMIHDIGNIYVPAEILNRPGKLSESELLIVQSHPSVGYEIVKGIDFPWPVADMILYHQERLDGSGYPEGLKGNAIPLEARIIAVADVVEAMLSHRPYRASFRVDQALQELQVNRGIKYDAEVVDACIKLFHEKGYTLPV